ncbi:MAG TPA: hypothetical protein VJB65_01830 [Patescibacteria group bacterium]|nr:hypothetical protein [Patescibacteria group bacterium]
MKLNAVLIQTGILGALTVLCGRWISILRTIQIRIATRNIDTNTVMMLVVLVEVVLGILPCICRTIRP